MKIASIILLLLAIGGQLLEFILKKDNGDDPPPTDAIERSATWWCNAVNILKLIIGLIISIGCIIPILKNTISAKAGMTMSVARLILKIVAFFF